MLVGGLGRPVLARFACDGLVLHAAVVSAIVGHDRTDGGDSGSQGEAVDFGDGDIV